MLLDINVRGMCGRRIGKIFAREGVSIEDAFSTCILTLIFIFRKYKNTEKLMALEETLDSHKRPIRHS
jgi:hypothetical protein